MNRVLHVVLCGVLVSCGSSDGSADGSGIEGQWTVDRGTNCVSGLNLDGSQYIAAQACPLTDGTIGIETEIGSYRVSGNQIIATGQQSSCPAHTPGGTYTFHLDGDLLTVGYPSGSVTFRRRNDLMGGQGQNRYGCWENGVLTPHDITRL